jgi:hypothetical protein
MCCEAMTPSCNDCRANAKKALADWNAKCKPAAAPKVDCSATPISDCCAGDTDECRSCRDAAMTTLVVWKEHCGTIESYPCDKKPPEAECCPSKIPSCEACRDRGRRLQEDWERRCVSN